MTDAELVNQWRLMLLQAVDAQARDETLWCYGSVTVGEAYVQQSLRWLHKVIEESDQESLKSIIKQANDED